MNTTRHRYQIIYKGVLAATTLTQSRAKSMAFDLAKEKGWELGKLEILEVLL